MRTGGGIAIVGAAVRFSPSARDADTGPLASADGHTGPEAAALAAADALAESRRAPAEVDGLLYSWMSPQGEHVWTPPHRVARLLGADRCVALGVQQAPNGGAAALREAVSFLLTEPEWHTAVAVTDDDFGPPVRGSAAVVVSRGPGRRTVTSIVSVAAPQAEPRRPETAGPGLRTAVRTAVSRALHDLGRKPQDDSVTAVLLSHGLDGTQGDLVADGLPGDLRDKVRPGASSRRNLGTGGLLACLAEQSPPGPGEHHLLVSAYAGSTVTAVLISGTELTAK